MDRSSDGGATQLRSVPVLRASGLWAEYTTGQALSGEWFALGSVRSDSPLESSHPAWVLVGTGKSVDDAISGLLSEMESEARRLQFR